MIQWKYFSWGGSVFYLNRSNHDLDNSIMKDATYPKKEKKRKLMEDAMNISIWCQV